MREDPRRGVLVEGVNRVRLDLSALEHGTAAAADRDDKVLQLLSVASTMRVTAASTEVRGIAAHAKGRGDGAGDDASMEHEAPSRGHLVVCADLEIDGMVTRAQFVDLAGTEGGGGSSNSGKGGGKSGAPLVQPEP